VEDLALHTARTQLARFLLTQAEEGQPRRSWTQEEIAAQIGTVREVVGRTLRAFAAAGLIRRERGRLVVMDRVGLEREAMMSASSTTLVADRRPSLLLNGQRVTVFPCHGQFCHNGLGWEGA
jgi:hypothetical protein